MDSIINLQTKTVGFAFSNDRNFDMKALGNGRGVRHFTIQNTGECDILINDATQQIIKPGLSYTENALFLCVNEKFEIKFINPSAANPPNAIVRYRVDVCS